MIRMLTMEEFFAERRTAAATQEQINGMQVNGQLTQAIVQDAVNRLNAWRPEYARYFAPEYNWQLGLAIRDAQTTQGVAFRAGDIVLARKVTGDNAGEIIAYSMRAGTMLCLLDAIVLL